MLDWKKYYGLASLHIKANNAKTKTTQIKIIYKKYDQGTGSYPLPPH